MITKDAVVEYYGSPAVRSVRQKLDPDLPVKHWWIIAPVARAIELAGRPSRHDELTFAAVTGTWAGLLRRNEPTLAIERGSFGRRCVRVAAELVEPFAK